MPEPKLSPDEKGKNEYTIQHATEMRVELSLNCRSTPPFASFEIVFPADNDAVAIQLRREGGSLDLWPSPHDERHIWANRRIIAASSRVGADTLLRCEIRSAAIPREETWEVLAKGLAGKHWKLFQPENNPHKITIRRIELTDAEGGKKGWWD